MTERLHLTFGQSAAGSLKQALAMLGRQEPVIAEPDDLGYGPIDPHSGPLRAAFAATGLGYEDDDSLGEMIDTFWREATTTAATPVAWLSRRCVHEYAGFLELVSRRDEPPLVVDVADINFVGRDGAPRPDVSISMGRVAPERMIAHDLFGAARRMTDVEFQQARTTWKKLKDENADLRVLDATAGLMSAPITFFDELITSCVTDDWQSCGRVIGYSLVRSEEGGFHQTGDLFLWSRLRALVEDGLLEGRGEMRLMRDSWVRRL